MTSESAWLAPLPKSSNSTVALDYTPRGGGGAGANGYCFTCLRWGFRVYYYYFISFHFIYFIFLFF